LIPAGIRSLPRLGCINVHPSLLPRWRGPEPIFWTFKAGDPETGVTVHHIDGGFDTGPILRQEKVSIPSGIDGLSLERQLATVGGRLLVDSIAGLANETLVTEPQDVAHATSAPVPVDEDLVIDVDQPAQRVFDLVRGIVPFWGPLTLRIPDSGEEFAIDGAVDFDPAGTQSTPVARTGETIAVRCNPGVVIMTLSDPSGATLLTPRVSV
jgi:methionyl-tRNA formyltransferase